MVFLSRHHDDYGASTHQFWWSPVSAAAGGRAGLFAAQWRERARERDHHRCHASGGDLLHAGRLPADAEFDALHGPGAAGNGRRVACGGVHKRLDAQRGGGGVLRPAGCRRQRAGDAEREREFNNRTGGYLQCDTWKRCELCCHDRIAASGRWRHQHLVRRKLHRQQQRRVVGAVPWNECADFELSGRRTAGRLSGARIVERGWREWN